MQAAIPLTILKKKILIRPLYILLALLIVGTFIRFYNLTYTSLWLDEIYSMKGADVNSSISDIYQYSKQDQPPLFFILLHVWFKFFGYTDYAGRALTCGFGVLGILSMYFLGKEVKNEWMGLFAAFVTTINWFHVGISMEIRFYALVFLLSTLSYLFFLRSVKRSQTIDLFFYAAFTSLLLNTHYFGLVLFTTQLLIFILHSIVFRRNLRLMTPSLIAGGLAALSILHWLPVIFHDLQIPGFHVKPLTFRFLVKFLWWYVYDPAALIIYIGCSVLAFKTISHKIRKKTFTVEDLVIMGWLFIGFLIPLLYSLIKMPLLTNKYCTIQLPAIFIFAAQGFTSLKNESLKLFCIGILAVSASIVLFVARPQYKRSFHEDGREIAIMYFNSEDSDKKSWNEDWREVANYFKSINIKNQVIFSQLAWFHEYYFTKNSLALPVDQNVCDFNTLILSTDTIWLLLHHHYTGGWPTIGFSKDQQNLIRKDFKLIDLVLFKKSKAFLYVRKEENSSEALDTIIPYAANNLP